MKRTATTIALLLCGGLSVMTTGCQSTVGGQTLPSAYYLTDDVQYFPAGPEFLLPNLEQQLEDFKLQRDGFDAEADLGGAY